MHVPVSSVLAHAAAGSLGAGDAIACAVARACEVAPMFLALPGFLKPSHGVCTHFRDRSSLPPSQAAGISSCSVHSRAGSPHHIQRSPDAGTRSPLHALLRQRILCSHPWAPGCPARSSTWRQLYPWQSQAHGPLTWRQHFSSSSMATCTAQVPQPLPQATHQQQPAQQRQGQLPPPSLNPAEAAKFAALAAQWWNPSGPFAPLLALNPARCAFIRAVACAARGTAAVGAEPLRGVTVLDVGCGGGLLSEPLARMGAQVHGIDVAQENVLAATAHAAADPLLQERIRYEAISAEALAGAGSRYGLVIASEVMEHVREPGAFLATLAALVDPTPSARGGVVISTLNRTPRAWAMAIAGAESILRLVPRGTHEWDKFITPGELAMMARDAGLRLTHMAGMAVDPITGHWFLCADVGVNYIAFMQPPSSLS